MLRISIFVTLVMTIAGALPAGEPSTIDLAVGNAWWQTPAISDALELTPPQRAAMDGAMRTNLERRNELRMQSRADLKIYNEALDTGDWKAAAKTAEKLAGTAAAQNRLRSQLKIDVLTLLSKEQLAKLVADHAQVIRRPWVGKKAGQKTRTGGRKGKSGTQKKAE